ncbi:MAG: hypothetical protein FK734_03815 [Asgard group archaeon]|nr:hypothetical protein [Asgard group archaeon]
MGFPRPTSFRTVLRFDFKNGNVVKIEDISEKVEELRDTYGDPKEYYPSSDSSEDIKKWIEKRFSLNSDLLK